MGNTGSVSSDKLGTPETSAHQGTPRNLREVRDNAELDCSNLNLDTLSGVDFIRYHWVEILNLSDNQLLSIKELPKFGKKLRDIDLSRNPLEELSDGLFGLLALQQIKSSQCRLQGAINPQLGNLIGLVHIDLSNNQLTTIPVSISKLTLLSHLNISFNKLREIPRELGHCTNMKRLLLNHNDLKIIPKEIGKLIDLQLLNISDNFIESLPMEIYNLKNLTKLYMDFNGLIEIHHDIQKMTSLKELNVRGNQLTYLPSTIGKLNSLNILDVEENKFSEKYNTDDLSSFLEWLKEQDTSTKPLSPSLKKPKVQRVRTEIGMTSHEELALEAKKNKEAASKEFRMVAKQRNLLRFKGMERIVVRRMEASINSLNHGDSFLLDHQAVQSVYCWKGDLIYSLYYIYKY